MNGLIAPECQRQTISSIDFLVDVINPARVAAGETPHEPRKFLTKVEDELDLSPTGKKFRLNHNQTESAYYDLDIDQLMLVGMRESKSVRRIVLGKLKELQKPKVPQTYAEALLEAGRLAMELQSAHAAIEKQKPAVQFTRQVSGEGKGVLLGQYAKSVGLGQNKLFAILRERNILIKSGKSKNIPYQQYIDRGCFAVSERVYEDNGKSKVRFTPLITGKGQIWLTNKLIESGLLKAVVANDNQGGAS